MPVSVPQLSPQLIALNAQGPDIKPLNLAEVINEAQDRVLKRQTLTLQQENIQTQREENKLRAMKLKQEMMTNIQEQEQRENFEAYDTTEEFLASRGLWKEIADHRQKQVEWMQKEGPSLAAIVRDDQNSFDAVMKFVRANAPAAAAQMQNMSREELVALANKNADKDLVTEYKDGQVVTYNKTNPANAKAYQIHGYKPKETDDKSYDSGVWIDDGKNIGNALKKGDQWYLVKPGGEPELPPATARRVTATGGERGTATEKGFSDAYKEGIEYKNAFKMLGDYAQAVKEGKQGAGLLIDSFVGGLKSFFGKEDISPEELNSLYQRDKMEQLLGYFREQVVGGGVMTEQDARRVINALGRSSSDWNRNKQVASRLLGEIMEMKLNDFNKRIVPRVNKLIDRYDYGDYEKLSAIEFPSELFKYATGTGPQPVRSSEDKLKYLEQLRREYEQRK